MHLIRSHFNYFSRLFLSSSRRKIERLWVYIVHQLDGTTKYQCPTCPAIYSHKHDVPKHIRRKHRVAKPATADATQRLSTPFSSNSNANSNGGVNVGVNNFALVVENGVVNGNVVALTEKKDAVETHMSTDVVEGSDGDSPGKNLIFV